MRELGALRRDASALDDAGYRHLPGLVTGHALVKLQQAFVDALSPNTGDPSWVVLQQRLLADPRVLGVGDAIRASVTDWVGPVVAHCGDICRVAQPGHVTRPHQDAAYSRREDALTVWVAVVDVPLHSGPLIVWPASHRLGLLDHGPGESGVTDARLTDSDWHGGALTAGDAIAFRALTVHASLPNNGSTPRLSVDYRYWPA